MTGAVVASVAALVLLSAALTAAQAAAFRIGASHLRTMDGEGFRGAGALTYVRAHAETVRSGVRLATAALDLAAVGLAAATWGPGLGPVVGTTRLLGAIAVVLLVAHVLPRAIADRHPVRLALAAAPLLAWAARWMTAVGDRIRWLEDALAGNGDEEVTEGERELRELWEVGRKDGVLEESENLLVERAFRLDELTAWDVMTPRVDMFVWNASLTLEEIVEQLPRVPYSRVPIYSKSVDDVTGIVYVREAYERFTEGERELPLSAIAREPFYLPGSLSLSKLLRHFQSRRLHMGIVADEFGGTDGLVTLEDVLEELVGDIVDETDVDVNAIVRVSETELDADAGVDLREINEALGVSLPSDEHRSLNGFILEELGHVPPRGESLERSGVRIDVLDATETQVVRARLTRLAEVPLENEGA